MADRILIEPDLKFVRTLEPIGGDTLKKCFQCATCSVVCNLSPEKSPFPRKEMMWAGWGLKERLMADPDVWLCHQCSDCTKYCPRGARPGDVLGAIRQMAIVENALLPFLARWMNNKGFLPIIFAIPVVILLIFMGAAGTLKIPEGEIIYRNFIPQWPVVDVLFPLTALWTIICSIYGIRKLWMGFMESPFQKGHQEVVSKGDFIKRMIVPTVIDILKHSYFKECVVNKARYLAHFNILWGFILLAITTACVATGVYLFGEQTPYSLANPIKWIANIGAIILIVGSILAMVNRSSQTEREGKSTYSDWLFLWVVLLAGVTGLLTEFLRIVDWHAVAYPMYFVHLVFVWFLFAYLPYSKFAHLLYRTTAMVYARYTGRELKRGAGAIS